MVNPGNKTAPLRASTDPRQHLSRCLRCYYLWDEQKRRGVFPRLQGSVDQIHIHLLHQTSTNIRGREVGWVCGSP